jgi:hypothetical protein
MPCHSLPMPKPGEGQLSHGGGVASRTAAVLHLVRRRLAGRHARTGPERKDSNDAKSRFCPLRGSRTTGGTTAAPWSSQPHGKATYPQSPTAGTRAKQAHTSLEEVGLEESHNALQKMNGADHVNSYPGLIGLSRSWDLKNERSTNCHVRKTNGQDFPSVDRPGFPLECFF